MSKSTSKLNNLLYTKLLNDSKVYTILNSKDNGIESIDIVKTICGSYLEIVSEDSKRYVYIPVVKAKGNLDVEVSCIEQVVSNCRGRSYESLLTDVVYNKLLFKSKRLSKGRGYYTVAIGDSVHKLTYVVLPKRYKRLLLKLLRLFSDVTKKVTKYTVVHTLTYDLETDSDIIVKKLLAKKGI